MVKRLFWPSSLKNRLFLSILLLVLLPSSVIQFRNILRMETMMKDNISQQNAAQLDFMKNNFEGLKISALAAMLQLERDPDIQERLMNSGSYGEEERVLYLQNKLYAAKHGMAFAAMPVHLTLLDRYGGIFTTITDSAEQKRITSARILESEPFRQLDSSPEAYFWSVHDSTDLLEKEFPQSQLFSQFARLETVDGQLFGYLRISLDIRAWLASVTNSFQVKQTYYIMNGAGAHLLQTDDLWGTEGIYSMLSSFRSNPGAYHSDRQNLFLYNGIYLPNTDWYIVNRFPLEALSGDIRLMKRQVIVSLSVTALGFMAVTFAIVSALVRPLRSLQMKMSELVERNLDVRLPEDRYRGEIRLLAQAFNKMIGDVRQLIARLRGEERQKEAIRFQMLMSQMNPHFLLNTLNTIKWNARNHGDTGTSEICQSLGRLLECSLNVEADLVHLKEELELVKAYLHIQSFRFDHRFEVEYALADGVEYALVPKLSLQPLVENAIKHGLVHMKAGGRIRITVEKGMTALRLDIEDNGQGMEAAAEPAGKAPDAGAIAREAALQANSGAAARGRKGIGLDNLRERLRLIYKGEASLELIPLEQGTLARLTVPLLISSPYGREDSHVVDSAGRG